MFVVILDLRSWRLAEAILGPTAFENVGNPKSSWPGAAKIGSISLDIISKPDPCKLAAVKAAHRTRHYIEFDVLKVGRCKSGLCRIRHREDLQVKGSSSGPLKLGW